MKTVSEKEYQKTVENNGKFTIIAIIVMLLGFWAVTAIQNNDDAMQKCQETQSFDTCHWSLNR